jgi:hypothetical protein
MGTAACRMRAGRLALPGILYEKIISFVVAAADHFAPVCPGSLVIKLARIWVDTGGFWSVLVEAVGRGGADDNRQSSTVDIGCRNFAAILAARPSMFVFSLGRFTTVIMLHRAHFALLFPTVSSSQSGSPSSSCFALGSCVGKNEMKRARHVS